VTLKVTGFPTQFTDFWDQFSDFSPADSRQIPRHFQAVANKWSPCKMVLICRELVTRLMPSDCQGSQLRVYPGDGQPPVSSLAAWPSLRPVPAVTAPRRQTLSTEPLPSRLEACSAVTLTEPTEPFSQLIYTTHTK